MSTEGSISPVFPRDLWLLNLKIYLDFIKTKNFLKNLYRESRK